MYVVFAIRLFQCRKNFHWENRLRGWDNFICCHFLINEFYFQIKKSFYSKWAKIYSYWVLFDSQRISVSLRFLLLWQVKFYSKPVNSFLCCVFFLIMRIRYLQCSSLSNKVNTLHEKCLQIKSNDKQLTCQELRDKCPIGTSR